MTEASGVDLGSRERFNAPSECEHQWEPAGLVFETELMEIDGRYIRTAIRQPDLDEAKCYFICRSCACHTYMTTQWVGFRLYGSQDAAVTWSGDGLIPANNKHITSASNRKAWASGEGTSGDLPAVIEPPEGWTHAGNDE